MFVDAYGFSTSPSSHWTQLDLRPDSFSLDRPCTPSPYEPKGTSVDLLKEFIEFFLHLDTHLHAANQAYGVWTYLLLFLIIFCETGLVVTPILPGDSLLFAAGALAAGGSLNVVWLFGLLSVAAVLGDTVNYHIGLFLGPKVLSGKLSRWLNPK